MKHGFTIFCALMGCDVALTTWALQHGAAYEGNPLGRIYYAAGVWLAVVVKLVAVLLMLGFCYVLRDYRPARYYLWAACAAMFGVCVHNFFTILPFIMGG